MLKKMIPVAKYKVKGYHYCPLIEDKDDVYSVTHIVYNDMTGYLTYADFTHYLIMTLIDFENYIAHGLPDRRILHRPISPNDLRKWNSSSSKQT